MRNELTIAAILLLGGWTIGCSLDKTERTETVQTSLPDKPDAVDAKAAPPVRISPQTHFAAAQMLERQGNVKGAIDQYEQALAANPDLVLAYGRLGVLYQKQGRFPDADQMFRRAIDAEPGSATLRNNLGYNYLAQGMYPEAEQEFRTALTLLPTFNRARMNLGLALAQTGRYAESFDEFRQVVSEDVAHYNIAVVSVNSGDLVTAEWALQQALALNPNLVGAREQLRKITSARGKGSGGNPVASRRQFAEVTDVDPTSAP